MLNNTKTVPKRVYTYLPYLRIFEPKTEDMYLSSTGAIKNSKVRKIGTLTLLGNYKVLGNINFYKI